jgi:peptide/nickel transport system permease protein
VNFLGDGLRDAFDPRQGARAARKRRLFGTFGISGREKALAEATAGTTATATDGPADGPGDDDTPFTGPADTLGPGR